MSLPTVIPFEEFNASEDAQTLREAMKGLGTDEEQIIKILVKRSNGQRQDIKQQYLQDFNRDIVDDLKSELGGHFEDIIVALMTPTVVFLCKEINKAMCGIGTKEKNLIEILCTKSNEEIQELVQEYENLYNRPLAEQICNETSGDFCRLLTLIVTGVRDPTGTIDPEKAKEQAESLFNAGEGRFGTDEDTFNKILVHSSFEHLQLIFEEYKNLAGVTIEQAVKNELSGEMADAIMTIIECVQSPPAYFACRLMDAMNGAGTDDTTLIRIIVSRSEIDLGNIKDEFERIYNKTLLSSLKGEVSGDYCRVLCALIGED